MRSMVEGACMLDIPNALSVTRLRQCSGACHLSPGERI